MEHPKDIGDRSTLAIMCALRARGYALLVPFGENTRYDLVIDDGDRLARVQRKTGRLRHGVIEFPLCSSYAHHPNPKMRFRSYCNDVEFFGVYCRDNSRVYLVLIEDLAGTKRAYLRVEPTRNAQQKRVRFAEPYEIGRIPLATGGLGARADGSGSCA